MGSATGHAASSEASSIRGAKAGSPTSSPSNVSGGGEPSAAAAKGSETGAKTLQNAGAANSGSPGEVKRGSALKATGAAAAKVGRLAAGTVGNLALGSFDVAKSKFGDMKDSALERIGESTGGKIAAAINARGLAAKAPSFGDDSLSAADESANRESEVAAFRDRS
jgi:hypothetical protein